MELEDKITSLKGVGKITNNKLKKINIETIGDLLTHYPRKFEDRSKILNIENIELEENSLMRVKVIKEGIVIRNRTVSITKILFKDDTGEIEGIWFNMPYIKNEFKMNDKFYIYGKVKSNKKGLQIENPEFCREDDCNKLSIGRIVPIYDTKAGISQKLLRKLIYQSLELVGEVEDYLPTAILNETGLIGKSEAIKGIHYPIENNEYLKSRERLVFDEVFILSKALREIKTLKRVKSKIKIENYGYEEIISQLKFKLTYSQKKVIDEIIEDIKGGNLLNRLIQGDVGSGKTIVCVIISYILIKNGYQVALMAPTEVLAKQHYESITELYGRLNINTVILTGSQRVKEKRENLEKIKDSKYKMIIGTHALIQDKVEYNNLGLVITDEQHRFGVKQRTTLTEKGNLPHTLVMTATPIPRTLGIIIYGDLDISIINELPPNRKEVETYKVTSSYRERLNNFVISEISKGRQCYIICPLVEETEKAKGIAVESYVDEILKGNLGGLKIGTLHGKMKNDYKNEVMKKFNDREIDVLISTTVIEVGINVPNATLMIIEDAHKFGLSQLHQLRGRVGRGSNKSYCILISDRKSKKTKERLDVICNNTDGFKISEKDLEIRGTGDFFGTRQHGIPEFKITNMFTDMEIIKKCQNIINEINNGNIKILEKDKKRIKKEVFLFMDIVNKEISL